jgi:hypothetical protein
MLIVALVLFVPAAIAVAVGAMQLTGTLPGNRAFGVTTAAAIRTESGFRLANRVAAPTTLAAGLLFAVGGAAALTMGTAVGSAVAAVAVLTALFTAGSGASMGSRAAEAMAPAEQVGSCGQACGGCSLKDVCEAR